MSLLPVNDAMMARGGERQVMEQVVETNLLLARDAGTAGVEWLDLAPHLGGPEGQLLPRYSNDGVHLTAEGYRAWASALAPYLPAR